MKHKEQTSHKKNHHTRPLKEDRNDEEYSIGLKSNQERAWLGRNAIYFEKHRRPGPRHDYD